MDVLDRILAERACTELCHGFARALDFSDQDHFLELFTEDAELLYLERHDGLEAIARFVAERPRSLRTRHVMSNLWIDVLDATTARGIAYCTLHAGEDPMPMAVGHVQDRYVLGDEGWRIATRSFHWAMGEPLV
ncbi:MAG: nuclear transport factor 2 family protein [Pseudomonadales bacterium]|jgi:3-phenylpropionate/cinnamic acid dioxygenase small subunit|nr:nuclear transport factor 2 family protein [Pseudomonadales bacterium]